MMLVPRKSISNDGLVQLLESNSNYSSNVPDSSGRNDDFILMDGAIVEDGYGIILDGYGWVNIPGKSLITCVNGSVSMLVRPDLIDEVSSDESSSEEYGTIYVLFSQFYKIKPRDNYIVCGITNQGRLYQDVYSIDKMELENDVIQSLAGNIQQSAQGFSSFQTSGTIIGTNNSCISESSSSNPADDKKNHLEFNKWSYVTFVKDHNYTPYSMYINGVKCDVKKNSSNIDPYGWKWTADVNLDINDPSNVQYSIGYYEMNTIHGYECRKFEGTIDSFSLWDKALEQGEIEKLYMSNFRK